MIELNFTGMCKNCGVADLELHSFETSGLGGSTKRLWQVRCRHAEACDRAEDETIERIDFHCSECKYLKRDELFRTNYCNGKEEVDNGME